MDWTELNHKVLLLMLCYIIVDGCVFAFRARKARITFDRAAALARLQAYDANDFRRRSLFSFVLYRRIIDTHRRFKMWRHQFDILTDLLREELEPQSSWAKQCAINSSGSWVRAELKMAATFRVLGGGSYLDAADLYAVASTSFHRNTFWPVIMALVNCKHPILDNIHFPFDDEEKLKKHAQSFERFQKHFPGTVAAGDGCAFKIKRPHSAEMDGDVQTSYTRKYAWAYGFILFCDGDLNIMSVEATHVASTNDAGMYASSDIHNAIFHEKKLPSWAHVVLDEAFGVYSFCFICFSVLYCIDAHVQVAQIKSWLLGPKAKITQCRKKKMRSIIF
jgi:hypothetical protein